MASHSSTLAWKIPWTEPGRLQSMGSQESDTTERLHFHFSLSCIGEGNGNPLKCSCLENPRDGGAWWAAVYGVAQSQTRMNRLSSSSSSITCTNAPLQIQLPCYLSSFLWLQLYHDLLLWNSIKYSVLSLVSLNQFIFSFLVICLFKSKILTCMHGSIMSNSL